MSLRTAKDLQEQAIATATDVANTAAAMLGPKASEDPITVGIYERSAFGTPPARSLTVASPC